MKKAENRREAAVITGLSGAGKSVAIKSIEDFGGFCVDNMPAALIEKFIRLIRTSDYSKSLIALGVDVRSRSFMDNVLEVLDKVHRLGYAYRIIFLEADDEVLLRRYSESRHRHPLSSTGLTLKETLSREREKLEPLRERADIIIDTSSSSPHDLKQKLRETLFNSREITMRINVISFGFKYGLPEESDIVIDTRFLPNPYYEPELSGKDGTDSQVHSFVMESPLSRELLSRYRSLLDFLIPNFIREGRAYLTVSVGCTGGRHRSVVIAGLLADHLGGKEGCSVLVTNRDSSR